MEALWAYMGPHFMLLLSIYVLYSNVISIYPVSCLVEIKLFQIVSGLLVHKYFYFNTPNTHCALVVALSEKQVPFSMAIGNGELVHECFPEHSRMGAARMKQDKETDKGYKKRGVSMERSKAGTKEKICPDGLNYPIKIQ